MGIQLDTVEEVKNKTNYAPLWNVILHDDNDHTVQYVVNMLISIFGKTVERAFEHAEEVHKSGRSIVDTTSQERAELKMEQIHAFGKDPLIPHCQGSMTASIEPVE